MHSEYIAGPHALLNISENLTKFSKKSPIFKKNSRISKKNSGLGNFPYPEIKKNLQVQTRKKKTLISIFSISIHKFPKIPKIILKTACDHSKDAKNSKNQGRIRYLWEF